MRWGQRQADRTGESAVSHVATERPCGAVIGRLLDAFDKEIARSVLFLGPVLTIRQSPAND
jgi:hypothetical protein